MCISTTTAPSRPGPPSAGGRRDRDLRRSLEVVVGDDGGDLDDDVAGVIEPGHLEIHPDQHGWTLLVARLRHGASDGPADRRHRSPRCSRSRASSRRCAAGGRFGFMAFHGGALEQQTDVIAGWRPSRPAPRCTPSPTRARAGALPVDHVRRDGSPPLAEFLDHVDVVVTIHGYGRWGMFTSLLVGGGNRELRPVGAGLAAGPARLRRRHRPGSDPA